MLCVSDELLEIAFSKINACNKVRCTVRIGGLSKEERLWTVDSFTNTCKSYFCRVLAWLNCKILIVLISILLALLLYPKCHCQFFVQ